MLGRKGSGKTTKLCELLSRPEFGNRAVLIDPPDNIDFGITVEDLRSMETMMDRQADPSKKFRLRYSALDAITFNDPDDLAYWRVEAIVQMCLDVGGCTLAVDEVDMFCNPYGIPPTFKHLLARGRHDNINLIWSARRPQEVSKLLLSQSDEFFVFQMHHPADVDYFRQFMAFEREQVIHLNVGQCLHWTVGAASAYAVPKPDSTRERAP